ncbi:Rz-like spanin [Ralstonia phage Firinga]|uniref:DUF2514 family protein n=3 Tax=Firingavirus TaxID=2843381 RepID=A0A7G5B9X7_9CAUD|nr:Rz-like spanin [Ralstonia phage RSK1]YP_010078571.1 Rz-like spanin [Ralstonia phage Firinga]QMV33100.1 hypothetical protein 18C_00032 [Ralstonia phage Firinga]QMV33359.1 hypothetical protein 12C_00049 [Ralstonia phage Hennie]BAO04686.1 hypothetical protein [Ralstonia phage RSK1]
MTIDWIKLGGIAALVIGLGAALAGLHHHIYQQGYEAGAARVQAKFDAAAKAAEDKRLADVKAAKDEGDRRVLAQTENANEAQHQTTVAAADLAAARDAAGRLQSRITELERRVRAGDHSTPAGNGAGQPGGDPLDVLIDVFRRTDDAAGQLGDYADKLRVAGLQCERDYDALMPR